MLFKKQNCKFHLNIGFLISYKELIWNDMKLSYLELDEKFYLNHMKKVLMQILFKILAWNEINKNNFKCNKKILWINFIHKLECKFHEGKNWFRIL